MAPPPLIPDASVVAKWLLVEEDSRQARDLRDLFLREGLELLVPALMFYEVASTLRNNRSVRPDEVEAFLDVLYAYEMETAPFDLASARETIRVARAVGATVYDSAYLVLAQQRRGVVVTADRRFEQKAASPMVASLAKVHKELVG